MLELRGVSKTFGALQALHPTDLDLVAGKTTVLIGPSGCGKSTLLRVIIGLIEGDGGEVHKCRLMSGFTKAVHCPMRFPKANY